MKKLVTSLLVPTLMIVIGCNKSEPGGTPGKEFKISAPTVPTTIKQGDTQTVSVSLDRDKDFKQDVKLKVEAPAGISAQLGSNEVKASEKGDVSLKIAVDKKAALGDYVIKVTGTPDKGTATSVDVKVKVQEGA